MRLADLLVPLLLLTGCHLDYVVKSGYQQAKLLSRREDIEDALRNPKIDEETKRKIRLSQEVKTFATEKLKLSATKNYSSFVLLDSPYVTYVVSAAPRNRLESYYWKYPIVGDLPYKGFFAKPEAEDEARGLEAKGFDTTVRGVAAYSTLGYFRDPLLSSMTRLPDHQLVNTLIHEMVHATVFIDSDAEFNERLATFLGNVGTEAFYLAKEGVHSKTLELIRGENYDDRLFSDFLGVEIKELREWYIAEKDPSEDTRRKRIKLLQKKFKEQILPRFKGGQYNSFPDQNLNNADLMLLSTYNMAFDDFECVLESHERNFEKTIEAFKKQGTRACVTFCQDAKGPTNKPYSCEKN